MAYKPRVLDPADGGTGVANSNTITLAGNLVTSGANSLTFTTTGATNVTLPTSGTLGSGTIGGSTGATDNAIIIANGTGGATVQASTATLASGVLNVADGASGTPAYAFLNDPDTGLYRSGTNTVRMQTNSTDVMTWGTVSVAVTNRNFNTSSTATNSLAGTIQYSRRATAVSVPTATGDYLLAVTSTAAPRAITLTTPSSGSTFLIVKDESGGAATNNITCTPEGGKTVDGGASYIINTNYGVGRFYYDGTNWGTW